MGADRSLALEEVRLKSRSLSRRGTRRDGGPLVIDAFFVRTADNSVRHCGRLSSGRIDEREHFFRYAAVIADIGPFEEPALKSCGLGILRRNDATMSLVAARSSGP